MSEPWWSDDFVAAPVADATPDASGASELPPGEQVKQVKAKAQPTVVMVALVAGLVGALIGAGTVVSFDDGGPSSRPSAASTRDPDETITQVSGSTSTALSRPAGSVAAIAAKVLPSVVTIEESSSAGQGTGSGVVLRSDGYILTNNHVVVDVAGGGSGTKLIVIPQGKTEADGIRATVVGTDPLTDLAVIKTDGGTWSPATLGKSQDLVVGDDVVAIGAPLGLRGTVTAGIVSALNRYVDIDATTAYDRAIQTDAAINPGNSGGALVNAAGQVIGINSAIATASGGSSASQSGSIGVGFAIPIDEAAPVAADIIRTGKASHPYLGVVTDDGTDPIGALITSKTDSASGQKSTAISPGSPADKGGLREGDVITRINDQVVSGAQTLIAAIRVYRAGDSVTVTYVRSGSTHTVRVTLAERPTSG